MQTTPELEELSGPQLLRKLVGRTLSRIEPEARRLADNSHDDDTIHRLRVGLRRLRTLLRELGHLDDTLDPQCEPALAVAFRQLGRWRDRQHVLATLLPRLAQQGGPAVALPDAAPDGLQPPRDIVAAPDFQAALAALNVFAASEASRDAPA